MKRRLLAQAAFFALAAQMLFAASYNDNPYQQKSEELYLMAENAFGEGDYDLAAEYAREAEENARLSEAYIKAALLRAEAETQMNAARARMDWAQGIAADVNFPDEYAAAAEYIGLGERSFGEEDYESAISCARLALEALAGIEEDGQALLAEQELPSREEQAIHEELPSSEEEASQKKAFPATYLVDKWEVTRDCFWTIAGKAGVYADSFLWYKLYEANKARLPDPDNPNLIAPGMMLEIPSLWGEPREGSYDPSAEYGDIREFRR